MEQAAATDEGQGLSWDSEGYYDLSVALGKSIRYHHAMSDFYSRSHDTALAVTALTGTSAFVALLPSQPDDLLAKILTAAVAIATTLDLVFNPAKKADVHERLHRKFVELSAKIALEPAIPVNLSKFTAERLKIEADEPPVRRLIDLRAQNDECRSRGVAFENLEPLGFFQRSPLAYLFDFNIYDIEKRKSKRNL